MSLRSLGAACTLALLVPLSGCQGGQASNQEKLDAFNLPSGYAAQGADPDEASTGYQKNVASQVYSIPQGADPCADLKKAFDGWADTPIKANDNQGCTFTSYGQDQMFKGNVNEDQTRVLVVVFNNKTQFPG